MSYTTSIYAVSPWKRPGSAILCFIVTSYWIIVRSSMVMAYVLIIRKLNRIFPCIMSDSLELAYITSCLFRLYLCRVMITCYREKY